MLFVTMSTGGIVAAVHSTTQWLVLLNVDCPCDTIPFVRAVCTSHNRYTCVRAPGNVRVFV